jgi:hypothetical protein
MLKRLSSGCSIAGDPEPMREDAMRTEAVAEEDPDRARAADLTNKTLIDIVRVVIENCLGNLITTLAQTELDDVLRRATSVGATR